MLVLAQVVCSRSCTAARPDAAAWLAWRAPTVQGLVRSAPIHHHPQLSGESQGERRMKWPQASTCAQALEVVSALLDPLPVPSEAAGPPDSPASVTELHASVRSATVQVCTYPSDGLPEDDLCLGGEGTEVEAVSWLVKLKSLPLWFTGMGTVGEGG